MPDFEVSIPSTVDSELAYADVQPSTLANNWENSWESDWAILNRTTPERFCRLQPLMQPLVQPALLVFSAAEMAQSCALLQSYHAVYRPSLLKRRAEGYLGRCPAPTEAQFQQIADLTGLTPAQVQRALQSMTQRLRQSRSLI